MSQREGPGAQPVEHPEDGQAGADGVARLDRDEAPDFSGQVSLLKFCRARKKCFTLFTIFFTRPRTYTIILPHRWRG